MFDIAQNLSVREISSGYFIIIDPQTTIAEAYQYFTQYPINELLLGEERHLTGIITINDVLRSPCFQEESYLYQPAGLFFSKEIAVIDYQESAEHARNLMRERQIGRLPVLKDGCVVGIVSALDLMNKYYMQIERMRNSYEFIFNQIHEGICVVDTNRIVRIWSKHASEMYRIDPEDILNKPIEAFFPSALLSLVLKNRQAVENVIHSPREGTVINISALPLFYENELVGAVSTDRDITDIINLTNELDNTKHKLNYLEGEINRMQETTSSFHTILGSSEKILSTKKIASQAATSRSSILIQGESGTGKELFARAIHVESKRKGLFVAINCSAIPEPLFESEMFGYVGGAFTGALNKGKIGKIQLANEGTLFLDEIADMPLSMQTKMLRAIQDKKITRVGDNAEIDLDFRIICATHRNLLQMVKEGKFREDLYYRLKVVEIVIPPLNQRCEDIPLIVKYFLKKTCKENDRPIPLIDRSVMQLLMEYSWPGNIRELQNIVEHLVIFSKDRIEKEALPPYILQKNALSYPLSDLPTTTLETQRTLIQDALKKTKGNKAEAAKLLGITRPTLYYKMKKIGMDSFASSLTK